MVNKIKVLSKENRAYVTEMRRHFHMHPESSLQEFETCKRIQKELSELGVPFRVVNDIGVIAEIAGAKPGKTVALRADIDALEITEKNKVPYASTVEGKMHACGHDAHTAMLLGAAKVLWAMRDEFAGTVRLIFQPAEELIAGAKIMIEAGCLEGVDSIFGIHVASAFKVGQVDCVPGPRMASADMMTVTVNGVSGHGARPDQCIDAVVITAAIAMNLQTIVSREYSPLEPTVVTIGQMQAGTRANIIANKGTLELSIRSFSPEIRAGLIESIKRVATGTAQALRGTVEFKLSQGTPPTINHEGPTEIARAAAKEVYGGDCFVEREKQTGSEDFAYYAERIPAAIAFVGSAVPGPYVPHHNEHFDIDENVLEGGTALYTAYALTALSK
ncbi:MAG TPA: amidohydrolase [Candidatus Acidoferrum sp.]|nr:amidohydrolase [Candidatus Acidoferrum sp.]